MKNHLILPATILLSSIVFGGFYYASEISKQAFVEKQTEVKLQENRRIELEAENQKKALEIQKVTEANQATKDALTLERSRIYKGEQCIKKAEAVAVSDFYLECTSNPAVGGSIENCLPNESPETIIQYIRSQKGISFGVFEIDKRLTKDKSVCTTLYGK